MQTTSDVADIRVTKLSPHIAAEVTGLDLRKPIDAMALRALYRALVDNIVLVIRNQRFTPAQFFAAVSLFGEPMEQDNPRFAIPDLPLVRRISNHNTSTSGERANVDSQWHTDHTNRSYPPKFTSLYADKLPRSGGGTSFTNMRAAYAALPHAIKQRIDGLRTFNVIRGSGVKNNNSAVQKELQKKLNPDPVAHPLVRTNPDNDTKSLYFHINKVENIDGMSPEASQAFLEELLELALKPELAYVHRWQLGDMVIWDNRSSLHKANYDYDPQDERVLYRVIVRGERPC